MHTLRLAASALIVSALVVSCSDQPTSTAVDGPQFARSGPLVHHVSVGGPDACQPPGCDANFSLVANEYADGRVSGQWVDSFGNVTALHVAIDCLNVSGNAAVVGGVIKAWNGQNPTFVGRRALTAVRDNGTSANDPADQISYSWYSTNPENWTQTATCHTWTPEEWFDLLLDLTHGQVKVR